MKLTGTALQAKATQLIHIMADLDLQGYHGRLPAAVPYLAPAVGMSQADTRNLLTRLEKLGYVTKLSRILYGGISEYHSMLTGRVWARYET